MSTPEPIPSFDLYAELGVSPTASAATIDAAWRALVKRHHPDALAGAAGDATAAARRIRRLNVAHDWLADPERRARYDRERALRPGWARPRPAAASPTGRSTGAEWRGPPPEWGSPPPSGTRGEVRWTRREPPPRVQPQPIRLSPFAIGALGVIVGVVLVGGALTVLGFAGQPRGLPPPGTGDRATLAPDAALAATIPGQVDGLVLLGESGSGVELFGTDDGISQLAARAGGDPAEVSAAYKSAVVPTGEVTLSVIALAVESVSGTTLAAEFQEMTAEDPDSTVSWTETTAAGRPVAVSRDADDPEVAAYLVSDDTAMYLVITDDPVLAETTMELLPY